MKVSILTVAYNASATIAKTIESVLNQTYDNIEYLILDGASKDNTVSICESYHERFINRGYEFKIISKKDKGMYDALNKGAKIATGDIVGQINADDWYEPFAVAKMVDLYNRCGGYDMAYADLRMVNPDGSSWIKRSAIDKFINTRHWNHPTQFTRRDLLLEHPYPVKCMSDDLDLFLYIRSSKKRIEVLNETIANFTVEGMSHSKSWKDIKDRIKTKTELYRKYGYSYTHAVDVFVVELGKYILESFRNRQK